MKKSLLALALLGAFAGAASAQTSTTVYGVLDAGVSIEQPDSSIPNAGNRTALQSGISTPSRIGFQGSEDFGGSLKAIFQLEAGILIDNGQNEDTGTLFNRSSWLGLSGDFGSVMVGRQFTPMYNAVYQLDPFSLGMAGNAGNIMHLGGANFNGNVLIGGNNPALLNGGGSQAQNSSMRYISQSWNNFSLEFNYGMGGQAGNTSDGSETGATINYINGPVMLLVSYDGINALNNGNSLKTTLVGGSINWTEFGVPLKTNIGYQTNNGSDLIGGNGVDSTNLLLGLRIPMGPHEVLFSYIHSDNKNSGGKADQFALGYTYALSKRTTLYTSVGEINNKNGDEFTLGNASNVGYGVKAFDLGLRHAF
jgi:predicted porin